MIQFAIKGKNSYKHVITPHVIVIETERHKD